MLNPLYTFENFVSDKEFIEFNMIKKIAKESLKSHSILLYGDNGLGKTHLLHAIGNSQKMLNKKVVYTTAELFMTTFTSHLRSQTMDKFRKYFRECDVLLIDDMHYFTRKEQTQEQLLHALKELELMNKLVVCSIRQKFQKNLSYINDLNSHLSGFISIFLRENSEKVKQEIIEKKMRLHQVIFEDNVIDFLLENSNINNLIGKIDTLAYYINTCDTNLSLKIVKKILGTNIKLKMSGECNRRSD